VLSTESVFSCILKALQRQTRADTRTTDDDDDGDDDNCDELNNDDDDELACLKSFHKTY